MSTLSMGWARKNWRRAALFALVLTAFVVLKDLGARPQQASILDAATLAQAADKECADRIVAQIEHLENEKLSDQFTFEKYKISNAPVARPADLDLENNPTAKMFRTMIRNGLSENGVNFAGHYTMTGVGMTGSGTHYWIIDRTNGRAYSFPYVAEYVDFKPDSNLIIVNPKHTLLDEYKNISPERYAEACSVNREGRYGTHLVDLRPFYFAWENDQLKLLEPKDIKPMEDDFWVTLWKEIFTRLEN